MKIVLLCRSYYPSVGGIETSIYQLSKSLKKLGHNITIVTTSKAPSEKRQEYADVFRTKKNNKFLALCPTISLAVLESKLKEIYKRDCSDADIIIGRDTFMTLIANRLFPKKRIIYIPSMDVKRFLKTRVRNSKTIKDRLLKWLEENNYKIEIKNQKAVLDEIDRHIVFCHGMKDQLIESYHADGEKISICYPGCSFDQVDMPDEREAHSGLRLLYVGRISPEKNLGMLLDALDNLNEDISLTIVGDGSGMDELIARAKEFPENIKVQFVGRKQNPIPYYLESDCFVFPSKYESFGQVIIEAFTCGLPVIGFATIPGETSTAIEELVQDGHTGLVCRNFSRDELRRCILEMYKWNADPEKMDRIRRDCFNYANAHCSWDNLAAVCLDMR